MDHYPRSLEVDGSSPSGGHQTFTEAPDDPIENDSLSEMKARAEALVKQLL